MSLNVGNLVASLGLDMAAFNQGVEKAQTKISGFASGFATTMSSMAVPIAAVAAAVAAIGGASVMAADTVDKAYATIRVGTGATGEALTGLQADFDAVFGEVPASAADIGTAIADLNTRLGLTGPALQDMATQFLELSRITGTSVAGNIKDVTRTFGDWGVAAEDQSDALDYLFKSSQATGATVGSLSQKMVQYGAPLRQMGFDFETSAAMMGKFEKEGVNTELVLGSMRIALGKMAKDGVTDADEALQILIDDIQSAGSVGEANALAIETFGSRAGPDMAAAIREGRFELDDLLESLADSPETIQAAADDAMTLGDRMDILGAKATEALEPVGDLLIGVFEDAMPTLEAGMDQVSELGQGFADWLGQAQQDAAPFVSTMQDKLAPATEFFQSKLQYLTDWWEEESPVFMAAWANISAFIQWVIGSVIVPLFEWAWPYIEQIYSGALDVMLNVAKLFASILAGDWESAGEALIDITKGFMGILNGLMGAGWDAIATGIEWVGQGIMNFIYDVWGDIVQYIETQINNVIDLINGMIESIESVTSAVGITLPRLQHVKFQAEQIKAPELKIQRWGESEAGKLISEYIARDETDDDDPDAEFEDEDAPAELPASALPVVAAPVIPAAPGPVTIPAGAAAPATEIPDIETGAPVLPDIETTPTVTVPAIEVPLPVLVDWGHMPAITFPAPTIPAAPSVEPPVSPPPEGSAPTAPDVIVPDLPDIEIPETPIP
ncbi:MAG: phage tail tape measure protein, partial [Bacilli bacterium]